MGLPIDPSLPNHRERILEIFFFSSFPLADLLFPKISCLLMDAVSEAPQTTRGCTGNAKCVCLFSESVRRVRSGLVGRGR